VKSKKLIAICAVAGVCAMLPACSMTDEQKATVKADVQAAATAAAPGIKQAVSDYAAGDKDAAKTDLETAGKAAAAAVSTASKADSASSN